MKTKYFRIENAGRGAYDLPHDGTILAVSPLKSWLLTDEYCGGNVEGQCYRHHVAGARRPWPAAAGKAIDKTEEVEMIFADSPEPISMILENFSAAEIQKLLKV